MATTWVLNKITGALQPTIQSAASTAGSYAGGALNSVGSGINGVGETINGTIKRYGDGVRDYGNGVMDWANAPGTRAQTAGNPLGLNSGTAAGKGSVTRPSVYSAPPKPKPKALTAKPATTTAAKPATTATRTGQAQPQKKIVGAPIKKAVPVSTPKKATSISTTQPKKTTISANSKPTAVTPKTPSTVASRPASLPATKQVVRPSTVTNPVGGMKPSTAAVGKAKSSSVGTSGKVGAGNPLGLSV